MSIAEPLDLDAHNIPTGVKEILHRAKTSWLKNAEVCDILVNHAQYDLHVSIHCPVRPPGGFLYLFDRRSVRFFRKDGHNWRKKIDGKTVRETHEKLKVGNIDMLNCYYAHSNEDNATSRLQRRCYWLLESNEDIVLVHYLNTAVGGHGSRSRLGNGKSRPVLELVDSAAPPAVGSDGETYSPVVSSDESERLLRGFSRRAAHAVESPVPKKARGSLARNQHSFTAARQLNTNDGTGDMQGKEAAARQVPSQHSWQLPHWGRQQVPVPHTSNAWMEAALMAGQRVALSQLHAGHAPGSTIPGGGSFPVGGRIESLAAAAEHCAESESASVMGNPTMLPSLSLETFLKFVEDPQQPAGLRHPTAAAWKSFPRELESLRHPLLPYSWAEEASEGPPNAAHSFSLPCPAPFRPQTIPAVNEKRFGSMALLPPLLRSTSRMHPCSSVLTAARHAASQAPLSGPAVSNARMLLENPDLPRDSRQISLSLPRTNQRPLSHQGAEGQGLRFGMSPGVPFQASWLSGQPVPSPLSGEASQQLPHPQAHHFRAIKTPFPIGFGSTPHSLANQEAAAQQERDFIRQRLNEGISGAMDAKATSESTLPTWPSQEQMKAASTLKLAPYTLEGSAAVSPARAGTALMSEPRALSSAAVSAGHPQDGNQRPSDTSTTSAMQRGPNLLARHFSDSQSEGWGADLAHGRKLSNDPADLTRSVLALDAELSQLETEMMGGMLAASALPAAAADIVDQLGSWNRAIARLEAGAQQMHAAAAVSRPSSRAEHRTMLDSQQPAPSEVAFQILDFSPEWDWSCGSAKLLLTGSILAGAQPNANQQPLFIMFDGIEVPAVVLQSGVLRCAVPPHEPGIVGLCITNGNGHPRSRLLSFEYRASPEAVGSSLNRPELLMSDKELQVYLIKLLMESRARNRPPSAQDGALGGSVSGGNYFQQAEMHVRHGGKVGKSSSDDGSSGLNLYVSLAAALQLGDGARGKLLSLLMQRETQLLALQVRQEPQSACGAAEHSSRSSPNVRHTLSPAGLGLVHIFAALGYEWGLKALLLAGYDMDLRDAWGHTALHWAAARGHEAATTALIAGKVNAALLTGPQAKQPGLAAADLAAANGYCGLAAYLAQMLLAESYDRRTNGAIARSGSPTSSLTVRKRMRDEQPVTFKPFNAPQESVSEATAGVSSQQGFRATAVDVSALVEAAQKMATAVQKSHSQDKHGQTEMDSQNELHKRRQDSRQRGQQSAMAWGMILEQAKHPLFMIHIRNAAQHCVNLSNRVLCLNSLIQSVLSSDQAAASEARISTTESDARQRSVVKAVEYVRGLGIFEGAQLQYLRLQSAAHTAATPPHVAGIVAQVQRQGVSYFLPGVRKSHDSIAV